MEDLNLKTLGVFTFLYFIISLFINYFTDGQIELIPSLLGSIVFGGLILIGVTFLKK